ncbi:iduronate 2-sulfatase-like [Mercenaria mercenaria]|uniref:iduronate 2-sulfatase-like n=1 Tax=Mercenaria mercenaria TaxID=6596 RepID=UPI00234E4017|nr:iduronate 2-sulfatase-like [Mercenaria mercenaria]
MAVRNSAVLGCLTVLAGICSARMNVLFLMADDLRPQLSSYYGSNFPSHIHPRMHTPNLNSLASRSLLLKRAYVQQAICSPSRASMLTGRRPDTTHVYNLESYFRNVGGDFTTLPEYFKLHGYRSMGMGKIYHGTKESGGKDVQSWSEPYFYGHNYVTGNRSWQAIPDHELQDKPLLDKQVADHAIKALRQFAPKAKTGEKNFFLAVGFRRPHLPFVFPASIMHKYYPRNSIHLPSNPYAPANMPNIAWSKYNEIREQYADIAALKASGNINTTLPDNITLDLRRAYYSAVTWVDSLVGEVIAELDRLGLSNNTVVSFVGDHGYQLGEHGEWCKHTNFEIATHAPMMIRIPGMTDHGITTTQLTEFVDLYPTIVEAAGLGSLPLCPENSAHVKVCREGASLIPLIKHPHVTIKKAAFSQYPRGKHIMGYSVRNYRYRYTEWVDFTYAPVYKPNWNNVSGVELYDHEVDPDENYNGADDAKYQQVRAHLSDLLHKGWRQHHGGTGSVIVGKRA